MKHSKKGFTLLEMLIVLGIIGTILAALTISFTAAQQKTRDARRKADIKNIANILEQYYSLCGYVYPTAITPPIACPARPGGFVSSLPLDPRATPYIYTPTNVPVVGDGFSLCTNSLETEASTSYCLYSQQ